MWFVAMVATSLLLLVLVACDRLFSSTREGSRERWFVVAMWLPYVVLAPVVLYLTEEETWGEIPMWMTMFTAGLLVFTLGPARSCDGASLRRRSRHVSRLDQEA